MKTMNRATGLLAALILAQLPLAARAQPVTGLYVGAGVGVNLMQDQSVKLSGSAIPSQTSQVHSQVGPAGVLSLGWGFGNGLRVEAEGNYRYNQLSGSSGQMPGDTSGGNEQKFGGMVNVLYDFVGLVPVVQPYVGVGIGYQADKQQNGHAFVAGTQVNTPTDTVGSFAYQAIIGAAMPIAAMPGLAVTLEYRFLGLAGNRSYPSTLKAGPFAFPVEVTSQNDYNHAFLVGVRYNFGQTVVASAVAAAPAPAPQAARSYLVFFDWDKATLTDRARQIIGEAAAASTKVQYTRIEVNGYTDTSGTVQYNQGLSVRRAQAVAAELVKDGVPKAAIGIQGFGETRLLVPTGPGVREPQNRRVEIIIR